MMQVTEVNGRRYACFARFAAVSGLRHAFSIRPTDVSARTDERADQRAAARRQMAEDLGLDGDRLCYCVQVHETRIARVTRGSAPSRLEGFDAVITADAGVPIMTFSADCPLVLVYDPRTPALGMVHASWRCTVARAAGLLVQEMVDAFGCRRGDLLAGIGPSAGPAAYEVGPDVYDAAGALPRRDRLFPRRDGRMFFNLWEANRAELAAAGLREENIEVAGLCTMTRTDLFFSYRREGAGCGHFGLMAALTPA